MGGIHISLWSESGDTSLISWNPAVSALICPSSKRERLGVDRGFSHRMEILGKNLIRKKKVVKINYSCLPAVLRPLFHTIGGRMAGVRSFGCQALKCDSSSLLSLDGLLKSHFLVQAYPHSPYCTILNSSQHFPNPVIMSNVKA